MIDLVYMIDSSPSQQHIGVNNTDQVVTVIKLSLNYLPSTNTRVGVVLYGANAKTESYFNYTRNQTHQALDSLLYLPAGAKIGTSLNYTREHFFNHSRPNAHRVLVVFTAGTSNDAVSVASSLMHDMNVTIIVVALGDWYDVTQVNSIASNPHSATVLLATHVEIVRLHWRVHEMICEGEFSNRYQTKISTIMLIPLYCTSERSTCITTFCFRVFLGMYNADLAAIWQKQILG